MTLSLTAQTADGTSLALPAPLELDYQEARDVPCAALDCVLPALSVPEDSELTQLQALLDGAPFFTGIVDRQTLDKSSSGFLLRLECRSTTALLVDNEVKPAVYFNLTSSQLFARYAAPFGVLGSRFPYVARRSYLQVNKGMSCWQVLEEFCRLAYGQLPFVTRDGILTLDPSTGVTRTLANQKPGGIPYLQLSVHHKRDAMISRLYMKTATEAGGSYYGVVFDNPDAIRLGVRRERYYHPQTGLSLTEQKDETRRFLDDSNRAAFSVEAVLPGIHDIAPGDAVLFPEESLRQDLVVTELRCQISDSGAVTRLTLSPPEV